MTVIADYVTVSTPIGAGADLRDALVPVCLSLPESQTDPLGVRLGRFGLLRIADQQRNGITVASCSGSMLAALRGADLLAEYVAAVASVTTYNVTHLDLARDEVCDQPAVLAHRYSLLRIAGVKLSRKAVQPERINCLFSRGPDGRDTGSIMIQHRATSRVSAIIYDRQHDARKKGKPDPGPVVRTELRLGVPGMTLRDVLEPAPLFYAYAAPGLLPRPPDVPAWSPFAEGGFRVTRATLDPIDRLRRQVERSTDLEALFRTVDQLPGEGIDTLVRLVRARYQTHCRTVAFGSGTRSVEPHSGVHPATPVSEAPDLDS
jgi:hypothetical protein